MRTRIGGHNSRPASHSSLKTASESQIPDKVVRDESWEQSHGRRPGSWMQLLPAQPNVVTENVIQIVIESRDRERDISRD